MTHRVRPPGRGAIALLLALAPCFPTAAAPSDGGAPGPVSFCPAVLKGHVSCEPTVLQFGPDGRLYVCDKAGLIQVYDVVRAGPCDYSVAATETVDLVQSIPNHEDADGSPVPEEKRRLVTGMLVTGTAEQPVLYVSSSDYRDPGGDSNSGVVSRLDQTAPGTWAGATRLDLVRGLPSVGHHLAGMALSADGRTLYQTAGGHTNMGASSQGFSYFPEYALSAAILAIDLEAIGENDDG